MMERSVFYDLYDPEVALVMEQKAKLLMELEDWLRQSGLTQAQAAERLGVDQPRVSDIKNGKFARLSLEKLMQMAQRAGIKAEVVIYRQVPHAA